MTRMDTYRALTPGEIAALEASGSTADDWSSIEVAEDFHPSQLRGARLGGRVRLASGVRIRNSGVRNYDIGAGTLVEEVVRLECRGESAFGNGTEVAVMNENGGRTVRIYSGLTAQIAYMAAVYRHRPALVAAFDRMARRAADAARSAQGSIGRDCRITDCRLLRDVCIGHGATLEGVSVLSNGTVGDFSRIGIDVKAYDFVTAEHALVDNGSLIERCFIGERCIFDRGYTASDSLFFANSHCENGEAVSIFAGPYTVSHHKSSLLIAGMFSFFNAGSGTNQSNHLFKCGAVHQAVHRRGCKFASGAYVMSPAIEGVYTMIMGRHTHHHDTSVFPFSYLLEQEGRSALLPGANLSSYGTVRDIEKWRQRDKRSAGRDLINFETWNPFVGNALAAGLDALRTLYDSNPDAQSFIYISSSRGCAAGYSATSKRSRRRSATCSRAAATDTTAAARGSTPLGFTSPAPAWKSCSTQSSRVPSPRPKPSRSVCGPLRSTTTTTPAAGRSTSWPGGWDTRPTPPRSNGPSSKGRRRNRSCNASRRPTERSTVRSTWPSATGSTPPRTTNAGPTSAPSADWNRET